MVQKKLDDAEEIFSTTLHRSKKAVGLNHPLTETLSNLGLLYKDQKKWDLAEKILKRAFQRQYPLLGLDHSSTWGTLINLGKLYGCRGGVDETLESHTQLLKEQGNTSGPENTLKSSTAKTMDLLCTNQQGFVETEELGWQVLREDEEFGPDHFSTLETINYVISFYQTTGLKKRAKRLHALYPDSTLGDSQDEVFSFPIKFNR